MQYDRTAQAHTSPVIVRMIISQPLRHEGADIGITPALLGGGRKYFWSWDALDADMRHLALRLGLPFIRCSSFSSEMGACRPDHASWLEDAGCAWTKYMCG
ncbi:hypothetical protein WOLCODRAFT_153519 [Wolfiporia cocos MD-104 SS10]|uniref:Uncharacterized protein n=1 Tax=Wolfiporia cocos (strain MD-104) TaxID=742152 RepID=A0A2H3K348_WOLCO|nr:hypothetical protein WOLCODRAFT_153519 [Wolfiporia cocos MD-104 SS10]